MVVSFFLQVLKSEKGKLQNRIFELEENLLRCFGPLYTINEINVIVLLACIFLSRHFQMFATWATIMGGLIYFKIKYPNYC